MKKPSIAATAASLAVLAACGGGGNSSLTVAEPPATGIEPPVAAQIRVIDADTVDIDGTRYRLLGIDAPESKQTCRAWGRTWDCGAAATEALMSRAAGMSCNGSETDRYGRVIGVCSSGGEDLNAWLVTNGWALAYRQYAEDYVSEEEQAQSNRRGIHRGAFIEPWSWRRGGRLAGEDTFTAIASGVLDVEALADRMLRGDFANVHGQWMEDSVSVIVDDSVAVSFGGSPGTTPTAPGGAVWRGALVGVDTRTRDRIEGDAVIDIDDFARPDVDIAFIGLEDSHGRSRADLRWDRAPSRCRTRMARLKAGSTEATIRKSVASSIAIS